MFALVVVSGDGHIRTLNLQGSVLKIEKKDALRSVSFDVFSRYFGLSKQFLIMNHGKILNDAKCSVLRYFDSGDWAVRGTESGQVVLFKILDDQGLLAKSWDGHFNSVNAIAVPISESGFFTAGNDGCICYYSLSTLKMDSWNAHSAPIIGLYLSRVTSVQNACIWSLSLDKKCKLWDSKGKLLKDWNFLDVPSAFSINSLETWMFVGTNTGIVFGVSTKSDQNLIDAKSSTLVYNSNDNIPITSLSLSLDELYLISGNKAGTVRIWDIPSQTCLNSVSFDGSHYNQTNMLVEIIGISPTINPLMDPHSIPQLKLKKLDKYPMSQEVRGQLYLDAISVRDHECEDGSSQNAEMDQNLLKLKQENTDLKILNAKLFKSAMNALAQKSLS